MDADRPALPTDSVPFAENMAGHVGEPHREAIESCRATLRRTPSLHYLAHYTSGVFDFSIDVLDRLDVNQAPLVKPRGRGRVELDRLGGQLTFLFQNADRELRDPRTGQLIRLVLHTPQGAIFCDTILPRTHLVGVAFDQAGATPDRPLTDTPSVSAADRAVGTLATALRRRVSISSQNPGGWETAAGGARSGPDRHPDPHVELSQMIAEARTERIARRCAEAVRPADLHLIAHCSAKGVLALADQLDHPVLAPFFTQLEPAARRELYRNFSRKLGERVTQFNRLVAPVIDAPLGRTVLDVEQGALFYYRLPAGEYLVGVTLDQNRILQAENRLIRLVGDCYVP